MAQRLALIVAPRYLSTKWLTPLDGTRLLPTRLQKVLDAHGHYDQIIMDLADKEVKRGQLRRILHSFFQNSGELLFYFYGHGLLLGQRIGVLATSDSEPYDEGVHMREVIDLADSSLANEVVLIFDCCHAGAALPVHADVVDRGMRPKLGRALIAACAEHEQSWEMSIDEWRKLGSLSTYVLEGLNGAAKNRKGEVTAASLGEYIVDTFGNWNQHPISIQGGSTAYACKLTWGFSIETKRGRCDFYEHLVDYPTYYVPRPEILGQVCQALLTNDKGAHNSLMQVNALHGMGGIGKTVIIRALCDDKLIRNRFVDGILLATLKTETTTEELHEWLRDWIKTLGGVITETKLSLPGLISNLAQLLHDRSCLLILDNVWRTEQVEPFRRAGGSHCRLLLTTRNAQTARNLGAQILEVPYLDSTQAVELLEFWAVGSLDATDITIKEAIVDRLGHLALAVQLAGVQLQYLDTKTWIEEFNIRELKMEASDDRSLALTLGLSLDALDANQRTLYAALTIFGIGEPIREEAVIMLWKGLANYKTSQTRKLLYNLSEYALLQINSGQSESKNPSVFWTVTFHDMLYELLSTELNHEELVTAHQALIASYRITQTGEVWYTAPDDGYLYNHIADHLAAIADQHPATLAELESLFANDGWMQKRVISSGHLYDGYLADLQALWERLSKRALVECKSGDTTTIAACVRCALIHTSVNSLASNYIPQLVKQAVETGIWSVTRALAIANRVPDPEQRYQCTEKELPC